MTGPDPDRDSTAGEQCYSSMASTAPARRTPPPTPRGDCECSDNGDPPSSQQEQPHPHHHHQYHQHDEADSTPRSEVPSDAATAAAAGEDEAFWSAVEAGDGLALAQALRVDAAEVQALLPALAGRRRERVERSRADAMRYRITWRVREEASATVTGHWLVVGTQGVPQERVEQCVKALADAGVQRAIDGATVRKVVVRAPKLVNVVV